MLIVVLTKPRELISWQELQDIPLSYDNKLEHMSGATKVYDTPSANLAIGTGGNTNLDKGVRHGKIWNQGGTRVPFSNGC